MHGTSSSSLDWPQDMNLFSLAVISIVRALCGTSEPLALTVKVSGSRRLLLPLGLSALITAHLPGLPEICPPSPPLILPSLPLPWLVNVPGRCRMTNSTMTTSRSLFALMSSILFPCRSSFSTARVDWSIFERECRNATEQLHLDFLTLNSLFINHIQNALLTAGAKKHDHKNIRKPRIFVSLPLHGRNAMS